MFREERKHDSYNSSKHFFFLNYRVGQSYSLFINVDPEIQSLRDQPRVAQQVSVRVRTLNPPPQLLKGEHSEPCVGWKL